MRLVNVQVNGKQAQRGDAKPVVVLKQGRTDQAGVASALGRRHLRGKLCQAFDVSLIQNGVRQRHSWARCYGCTGPALGGPVQHLRLQHAGRVVRLIGQRIQPRRRWCYRSRVITLQRQQTGVATHRSGEGVKQEPFRVKSASSRRFAWSMGTKTIAHSRTQPGYEAVPDTLGTRG